LRQGVQPLVPRFLTWHDEYGEPLLLNSGNAFLFDGTAERAKITEGAPHGTPDRTLTPGSLSAFRNQWVGRTLIRRPRVPPYPPPQPARPKAPDSGAFPLRQLRIGGA
jgi:hypothetical protein